MNRTDRLHAIVEELRVAGPRGRSSSWLAERFEVSPRTIKRDISALEQAGVPLYGVEGRGGGYRLLREAALPPLTFTAGQATAVAVALAAEPHLPFGDDGRAALAKVLGAMTETQCADVADLAARVWMRVPASAARPRAARVLDEALRTGVVATVDYLDAQGRRTRRRPVEPMAFARTGGHWYLLAWCQRRSGPRWFRLDRVTAAHLTRQPVADRDLETLFGPAPPDAHPVTVDV